MAEHHMRCRFWPNCRLHLGQERPRQFSAENRTEMRVLHVQGWALKEIAESFDTSAGVVAKVLKGQKQ
jgi:hypothetical protein